jgi:hypothetical protein
VDISHFTETDVREALITPILDRLGYRSGTANDIRRELTLRYPQNFLGRKKPATDPAMRGRADYVCEIDKRIRWIIEAKPPQSITPDDIEQAYTYARHPEIRAQYFAVCNGYELRLYGTDLSPQADPLLTIDPRVFDESARQLNGLLAPDRMRRKFADVADSTLPAIGPGLQSFAQIVGGETVFEKCTPDIPAMTGMVATVTGGSIQRDDSGGLLAYIITLVPFTPLQRLNEKLGLSAIEVLCPDSSLSIDALNPSRFDRTMNVILPRGERILNMANWKEEVLAVGINCKLQFSGAAVLAGKQVTGQFSAHYFYVLQLPGAPSLSVNMNGRFRLVLS